jgi:hypothetical protein
LVHSKDPAALRRLALERAEPHETYFAAAINGMPVGRIARDFARRFGTRTRSAAERGEGPASTGMETESPRSRETDRLWRDLTYVRLIHIIPTGLICLIPACTLLGITEGDFKMFDQTSRAVSQELTHMFPAVCIQAPEPLYDAGTHERAVQALRDVRHLLPREGIEIVDAVLDRTF